MTRESGRDETPPTESDSLESSPSAQDLIGDSPAGVVLQNFLEAIEGAGDEAEDAYERAQEELRRNAPDVTIEIARAMRGCDEEDYPSRWALTYAAGRLQSDSALPLLRSLILTPIPPEKSNDPHSFSTAAEETVLRTTAVDGVRDLVEQGSREAREALFEFLSVPSLSVRRAAVQAILRVGDDRGTSIPRP